MARQERAARTRRTLIHAAALVFAERGYAAASLGEVSGRAEVSSGALHFHFPSKRDLAQAVDDAAAEVAHHVVDQASGVSAEPLQQLVGSVYLLARRLAADPLLSAGFELGYGPRAVTAGAAHRAWALRVEETAERAARGGTLAPGVSAGAAAAAVVTTTTGLHVMGRTDVRWLADCRVEQLLSVLLPALAEPVTLARLRLDPLHLAAFAR